LWWFLSSALLVLVMDQAGAYGTKPAGQQFPLLNLGLGAAVAMVWLRGWGLWPVIALAGVVSGALLERGWLGTPFYVAGLVLAAGTARATLKVFGFDARMRTLTDVLGLAVLAAPAAGLVSALLAGVLPSLLGLNGAGPLRTIFIAQAAASWSGIILLTPFLFSLRDEYFERWNPARVWEWIMVNLLLLASLLLMMNYLTGNEEHWFPLAYLSLPFVFWSAWRFGPPGAALANIFVGAVTCLCSWAHAGPFTQSSSATVLFFAWTFLAFHGLIALLLAAATDERRVELLQQRQRVRFLRQVIEQLPCGVLLKDIADRPILVNRRWFQLFGRNQGSEEDQLRHQQSIEPFWRARELTLLQNLGEVLREETESADPSGQTLELLLTKHAAYFDTRGERLLLVVAEDLVGGRASLRETRAVLTRVRETLAVAEVGLWDWHIPTGLIRYDTQFCRLTSLPEQPEGLPVSEWQESIHPEDLTQFQNELLRHLHHQTELFATRFRFRRENLWMWLVVRGRVVEQDVRKLGVRMIGTLQEARATVLPLPDPNAPAPK
jgi:PAS domain-containing protein